MVWMRYSRIISVLPVETRAEVMLNVALLFLVSIEPYLLSILTGGESAPKEYASVLYALDLAGLMAILAVFTHALTSERSLIKPELKAQQKQARNLLVLTTVMFLVSLEPVFWAWTIAGSPVRYYLWGIPLVLGWISRTITAAKK